MFYFFGFGARGKNAQDQLLDPVKKILDGCNQALRLVFFLTFVVEVLSVAPILYMLNMYDRVLQSRSSVTLVTFTILVLGVYVFWSALEWIRARFLVRISLRIDWDLAGDVFDAAFRRHIGKRNINAHQVFGDLTILRQFMTGSSLLALMKAPFGILFIVIGAFFHPYLAIFALVAMVLLLITAYANQRMTTPALKAANDMQAESVRMANQVLKQGETALALGMQPQLKKLWHEKHLAHLQMQIAASEVGGVMGSLSNFLAQSLPSLQIALGVFLAIEGLITGGMVMAASFLISRSVAPIQQVLGSWKAIIAAGQAYERLNILLREDQRDGERMELPPPLGKLAVSNVTVMPEGAAKPLLQNLNFSAEPGTIVAVVGPSAAGKSTLAKLLVGIWKPLRGSVRLDGAEISDWAHDNLGRYIGYVPQEVTFFEGSVADNIARLNAVNSTRVVQAARIAGVHDMILALPQGYDTRLGDDGYALTGGQKQRLALARALYGNPLYLVMDEPNANLDDASERYLKELIGRLRAEKVTVVFTTHRPSLVNCADYMLVLNDSRQIAYGKVDEVINAVQKFQADKQVKNPVGIIR